MKMGNFFLQKRERERERRKRTFAYHKFVGSNLRNVNRQSVNDFVLAYGCRQLIDFVGNLIRCRATILTIEFYSEIVIRTARVMRCSQNDATCLSSTIFSSDRIERRHYDDKSDLTECFIRSNYA